MQVRWSNAALGDLGRLHAFLTAVNPRAATAVLERLKQAPRMLQTQPHMGKPLTEFEPREVRRLIVGDYELRYEVARDTRIVLRLWHTAKTAESVVAEHHDGVRDVMALGIRQVVGGFALGRGACKSMS